MRPRPSETIAGIRAILDDTIAPELTGEHARARLSEIRSVLGAIDWDNVGFDLVMRSAVLAGALELPARRMTVVLPSLPDEQVYLEYERYYDVLAALAVEVLADLRERLVNNPHDGNLTEELDRLLNCL